MKLNLCRSFIAALSASFSICAAYASTTEVDDRDGTIAYGGTWGQSTYSGCYDTTQSTTNTANSSAQYSFTGTSITWIGALWSNQGVADVYIDGAHQGNVDAFSNSDLIQQNLFERTGLSAGTHTIKLVCTGTNSGTGSDNTYLNVDAFIYSTDSPWTGTKVDDRDTSITYNAGSWSQSTYGGCYDGTQNSTNASGDYAQFSFTGTKIRWIGALWTNQGITAVYIDGVHQGTVDAYSSNTRTQQNLFEKTGLSNGVHTIKLVCTGTNSGTGSDNTYLNVDAFEYGGAGTWTASTQLSSIQGQNQWYYQQRPQGGGTATNMLWNTGGFGLWWTSDQTGWMGSYQGVADTRPGSASDTVRKWVAPYSTTVSITGRVYKLDTAQLKAAIFTVEKNGTSIWGPKTVAYNDTIGYTTDASLGAVSVNSGDSIAFIVDDNGTWADSWDGWDPTLTEGTPAQAWQLNTSDTLLKLGIIGNGPAIAQLKDANGSNWNWTPSPITLPLLNSVYIASAVNHPNWRYTTASVDTTSGTKVTLTFNSQSPSLALTQVWWARPGVGPVEETQSITNNSGSSITVYDSDVITSDLTVTADNAVTLWRFDRSSVQDSGDPNYNAGILKTTMASTTSVSSTISNDAFSGAYILPFEMLDVGGVHGCYMGYESDFGLFTTSTSGNADVIRNLFQLWSSNSFTIANAATIALPGMFYGAYTGDTDTGSNHMKKWFWNNKMTPTIISTTNEPLVEVAASIDWQYQATSFFNLQYPSLSGWGVESVKEDSQWTDDWDNSGHGLTGWDWIPNTTQWPNGFSDGSFAHSHGLKLVLYLGNTFNDVDLSTTAGVTSEEGALVARYGNSPTAANFVGGYDIWRTDIYFEATTDYLSHLGFLQVVDYMISNQSGFRWENCSGGGSKKSFDLLQRQSYMCVDDSGARAGTLEDYRKSYYPSSYMINPVQLEAQNIEFSNTENNPAHGNYMFRLGFMGAWMNFLSTGTSIQDALYSQTIPLYKTHQRPILRGADVYHILPICDSTNWDGMEFFNSALNKGSVILFKPNSSVGSSPSIVLKGLIPTNTYSLKFQDRSGLNSSYTSVSGSSLMTTGISAISGTTNEYDSEIIWINY